MADDSQSSTPAPDQSPEQTSEPALAQSEAEVTATPETPAPEAVATSAAPVDPNAPAPQAQQPQVIQQYVVTQQSLQGLGGWLVFFLVVFALLGIGYIMMFTQNISGLDDTGASRIVSLIFSPIIAIGSVAAAALIALQRKLAIVVSLSVLGVSALYSIISIIVAFVSSSSYSSYDSSATAPVMVGSILATLIFHGLLALYFVVSKRVKQTLIH